MSNPEEPAQVNTEAEARHAVDDGDAEQQRLNAMAPVDTERLDIANRSIDAAKAAADELRRQQREDADGESDG